MDSNRQPSFFALLNPLVPIRTLWKHRQLLWQFTLRNFELRHKGSLLGLVWSVLNPLILLGLYVIVFRFFMGGSFNMVPNETPLDYALGVFLGLAFFHLIAEALAGSPALIWSNPNFVKKVVFPLELLPVASVLAAVLHLIVSLVLVLAGIALLGRGVPLSALLLPAAIFPAILFALGISWSLSAIGVFFRDVGQFGNVLATGMMFGSAVFYPAAQAQAVPQIWAFLRLNPLIHIIEIARDVTLWNTSVTFAQVAVLNCAALLVALAGFAMFARLKPAFADVL